MQYPNELQGQASPPINPISSPESQEMVRKLYLAHAYNAAGGNFYSIAVFSLINSVIAYFEGGIYFPIGLAVTQVIDAFSSLFQQEFPEAITIFFGIGVALDLTILVIVALFGFFIKRQIKWLIVVGGILYLLDGLIMLLFKDWIGAGFHAYFLFRVWQNWQAIQKLTPAHAQQSTIENPF